MCAPMARPLIFGATNMFVSGVRPPTVTVIIATFHWSSALRCAIRSVLQQSYVDFELLVSGDGCTDDSESVVRAFEDPRLFWLNLERNHGSQYAPNNLGLSRARGQYVAYLGHDDLWAPDHLERMVACAAEQDFDVVCAGALLLASPESGVRCVTGFFPHDEYTRRNVVPPSSLMHTRALGQLVGGWLEPEHARVAVDVDFLWRCIEAGARVGSTASITVFKFNAAWRRDCYRRNVAPEQEHFLAQLQARGPAFLIEQLTATLRAADEDKLHRLELDLSDTSSAVEFTRTNAAFKGTASSDVLECERLSDGRRRYHMNNGYAGFEWHQLEGEAGRGGFRWSGPSTSSSLRIPEALAGLQRLSLNICHQIHVDVLRRSVFLLNGQPVTGRFEAAEGHGVVWSANATDWVCLGICEDLALTLTIQCPRTWRPADLGVNFDRRWLGLAISWVEVM